MSRNITRFSMHLSAKAGAAAMLPDADGGWVGIEDYKALLASYDELANDYIELKGDFIKARLTIGKLREDYAALAAENERLRKAGDVTIAAYCMGESNVEKHRDNPVVAYWLAAKEGGAK